MYDITLPTPKKSSVLRQLLPSSFREGAVADDFQSSAPPAAASVHRRTLKRASNSILRTSATFFFMLFYVDACYPFEHRSQNSKTKDLKKKNASMSGWTI